jgi:predicted alpha-1,2-mannosidase
LGSFLILLIAIMIKKIILIISLCAFFQQQIAAQTDYTKYVNPFIGTGGHGHTYPGVTLPHGMVQLSPDTRLSGWDGCGGYHYSDNFIYGFSHTHLSGTGVSDYGDILVMPMNGTPSPDNKIYGSSFSHLNENATAGYYAVKLDDDNIEAAFTTTERVGFHHYIFSSAKDNNIILDLKHRDEVIESSIKIEDSVTVTGLRRSKAWADNQYVFFVMKFSKPITKYGIWENDILTSSKISEVNNSKNLKAFFQFNLSSSKDIYVKVAISPVSVVGAKKNLAVEIPDWNFETIRRKAHKKWNNELSKIEVQSKDENQLKVFYTALYHTAVVPNINMDVDAQYRGRDNKIHTADGFTYYSVFSLWDTYRAANPLYTIIDKKRTLDYIKTFLVQYQQGGRLPVWELSSCETDCMIGYHSVPVIVDAYMNGITAFDKSLALEAMKKSATWNHLGLPAYMANAVISMDDENENVSKTLEYAFDDWCIAIFAKALGNQKDYHAYIKRAQYYKNILDPSTTLMRPIKNGDWLQPFDPKEVNNNFTEANSWQYSFYFPQDIDGYLQMTGGSRNLEKKLDNLFTTSSKTTGRDQSDITGLIGQYAHGNEPSHHIIYLYDFAGKPFKAQQLIHKVMTDFYKNDPDGLIGNEDCGQMSAWYVLSALGFYPVTPGSMNYMIGTPAFSSAKINLENGKSFEINAKNINSDNFYIQSIIHNNVAYKNIYLQHALIMNGGTLNFIMGNKPSSFGENGSPVQNIADDKIVINPTIHGGAVSFKKSKEVKITSPQKDVQIYYSVDGSTANSKSPKYAKPIYVDKSIIIKAIAINKTGLSSFVTTAVYKKMPHNWSIKLNTNFEHQYNAGGADGLLDGIKGTTDWRKGGAWQGYQKAGVDAIIDFKENKTISVVSADFLQDTRAWIIMPIAISISVSKDGNNFREVYTGGNFLPIEDLNVQKKNIEASFAPVPARYVRIIATQYGKLPSWHEGAGGDSHIFIDEIEVK